MTEGEATEVQGATETKKAFEIRWSTTYLSEGGYEVTLTFAGEDLAEVMEAGKAFVKKMRKHRVRAVRTRPDFPVGRKLDKGAG